MPKPVYSFDLAWSLGEKRTVFFREWLILLTSVSIRSACCSDKDYSCKHPECSKDQMQSTRNKALDTASFCSCKAFSDAATTATEVDS